MACAGCLRTLSAGADVKLPPVSLLPDYSRQAERYDQTRSASPSVLRPLCEALEGAPGRRLADIGGGTGNYALALKREGWEPLVVDRSAEMLARAAAKGLEVVEADAQQLPFDEDAASLWVLDYFPSSRPWMAATHPPRSAILDDLPGARLLDLEFKDIEDASLAALSADPERELDEALGRRTPGDRLRSCPQQRGATGPPARPRARGR